MPNNDTPKKAYLNISNKLIEYQGAVRTLREWCQLLRLNYLTVRMRYHRGERDTEKLFNPTPVPKHGNPNPDQPRTKKIAAATYPQAFYNLPFEIREPMMLECEFSPSKIADLITDLVIEGYSKRAGLKGTTDIQTSPTKKSTDTVKYIDISDLEDMLPEPTGSSAKYRA